MGAPQVSGLPPLPPGFEPEQPQRPPADPDFFKPLLSRGVEATNGYRTPKDIDRLRAKGYTPAANSKHLDGDALDLTPGKSGLSMRQLEMRARALTRNWPGAKVINEGHHVHVQMPGWGMAPGTPGTKNSGLPALPAGFNLEQRGSLQGGNFVRDGDTFKLPDGRNARVQGMDAYELNQQGRRPDGSLVPLGRNARDSLASRIDRDTPVSFTGGETYGRPVVTLGKDGSDPALGVVREGNALAAPEYLQGSPQFSLYMEAERLARQNLLGGHGTNAETPSQYRHKDGPWKGAEPGVYGQNAEAVFGDERMPFMGLRDEIEQGYITLASDPKTTAADLMAYAQANGFKIRQQDADEFIEKRKAGYAPGKEVIYAAAPKPVTDTGHGAAGAFGRGVADPINFLDEMGGVLQTVGFPSRNGERETVWNSDRRFGDILWNNIDQNRAILAYDDEAHPVARIGGQLTSAVAMPFGTAARAPMALAKVGAAEGALAGLGAGEGTVVDRLPNAGLGAVAGAAGGLVLGKVVDGGTSLLNTVRARRGLGGVEQEVLREAGYEAAPIVDDGLQNAGPTPAARSQPEGGAFASRTRRKDGETVAEMRADDDTPELISGPVADDLPLIPDGFVLDEPALGATRPMGGRPTAEDMAATVAKIDPADVVPIPSNRVASIEEAQQANPGPFRLVEAPDELGELERRALPAPSNPSRSVSVRGPLDVTQRLRAMGGIRDEGGELSARGIGNAPRKMDFGSNEQFIGRLVNNEQGMSLDEAAERLWEEGYWNPAGPRPTPDDLLERLDEEARGLNRYFKPDDLNEVSRFEAARDQRFAVEKAEQEGAPLAEEIGEPATMADLEANQPPVTAYEDLPTLGGKVANIDLSKVETKEDISRLLQATETKFGGFDASRRGKVSQAETAALADELNMTADDLLKRRNGQALNAEQALAARRILAKSGDELVALAKRAKGGSEADLTAFRQAMLRHAAIQEQVTGATAEAGRALAQFKMLARSKDHQGRILKAAIDGAGGRSSIEEAADAILDLQRVPAALNKFARDAVKPSWKDKLVELWYNSLLSGPQTHAVNILSNSLTAGLQLPEHLAAGAIGKMRSALFRNGKVDRVLLSEIGPRTVGLMQGAREGLKAFQHTLRTGDVPDFVTKVESATQEAIGGTVGKVARVPTRLLSAEDEFFKATARRMELAGLAVRKARSEGLKGEKLQARIAVLTANPTDEMVERSMDYARYLTFQRQLGSAMQKVSAVTQEHPWLKLFIPFIRTPTNILKFAVERSPAAPMLKEVRKDFVAGGARRDLATARMALGTGLGLTIAQLTADGHITGGGPADENARQLKMADGWQPYSIKVGDKYYSYRRLDPLATTLGVAADMMDLQSAMTEKQKGRVGALVIASVMQNLENKTWLSGLSDVLNVVEDPMRNSQGFIERLAGSVAVPTLSAQVARTIDPVARETSSESYAAGILDAIRNRIPGQSQQLLPKRNVFGDEIRNEGGVGPDLASPVPTNTAKNDPLIRALLETGTVMDKPSREVGGAPLPDDLYDQYQSIAGQLTRQYLEAEMQAPDWQDLTREQRRKRFDTAKKDARRDARDALIESQR